MFDVTLMSCFNSLGQKVGIIFMKTKDVIHVKLHNLDCYSSDLWWVFFLSAVLDVSHYQKSQK